MCILQNDCHCVYLTSITACSYKFWLCVCDANFHDLVFQQLSNIQCNIVNHGHHAVYYIHRTCNFKLIPTDDINPFYPSWKLFPMQLNWKILAPEKQTIFPIFLISLKSKKSYSAERNLKELKNLIRNMW